MTLEEKIAKLNEIADAIDGASLEESLKMFEEGVRLADECMVALKDCKGKLTVLQEKVRKLTDEN